MCAQRGWFLFPNSHYTNVFLLLPRLTSPNFSRQQQKPIRALCSITHLHHVPNSKATHLVVFAIEAPTLRKPENLSGNERNEQTGEVGGRNWFRRTSQLWCANSRPSSFVGLFFRDRTTTDWRYYLQTGADEEDYDWQAWIDRDGTVWSCIFII